MRASPTQTGEPFMNPSLSSLEDYTSTLNALVWRFGPKVLAGLFILVLGYFVSGWVGR